MFHEVQDTKDWFVNLQLNAQNQILSLWSEGDAEELESEVGEDRIDEFREMLQIVREAQSNSNLERDMIIQEMVNEGFSQPIALTVYEEVAESVDARTDLMFMKRYLDIDQHRHLSQASVDLYLGRRGESEILDENDQLFPNADINDMDLLSRSTRFMYSAVADSVQELGGIARVRESSQEHAGYSEDRLDAYFEPIEEELPALQRVYYYNRIEDIRGEVEGIHESIDEIGRMVSDMRNEDFDS